MNRLLVIPAAVFFVLGIIGLLIPIIPQIPFFVVSIILFAAASHKFKMMVVDSELYKKYLKKYIDKNEKLSDFMNDNYDKHL